jgi:coproporphyrinogen III oxidase-like Fe-S oxidoreductase
MIFNFPSQTAEKLRTDIELAKSTGANQVTFYPLMASPAVRESLRRTVGKVDYVRESRFYQEISERMSDSFSPASAWTFSRTGGGMIDEYIVDYEDYVGLGSGAFSFLEGTLYVNTFSLQTYGARIAEGKAAMLQNRAFTSLDRMRYRFLMSLFGMRLDKRQFALDFGVPIELGLAVEIAFMRSSGAFAIDNADELVLSATGRYLLVAMMREFFVGVNNVRDQAREALPAPERELLFGEADGLSSCVTSEEAHVIGAVTAGTKSTEGSNILS